MGPSVAKKRRGPLKKKSDPGKTPKNVKVTTAGVDVGPGAGNQEEGGVVDKGGKGQQQQPGWFRQKFREEWCSEPAFKAWLEAVPDDPFHCWCRVCQCQLTVGRSELLKHANTQKHKRSIDEDNAFTDPDGTILATASLVQILESSSSAVTEGGDIAAAPSSSSTTVNDNTTLAETAENGERSRIDQLVEDGRLVKILETTPTGEVKTTFSTITGRAYLKPLDEVLMSVDLRLAAFAVEHNLSGTAIEHLGDLIDAVGQRPDLASKIRMTKRKCVALVKNVLAKSVQQCLNESLQTTRFSLIVDEAVVQGSRVVTLLARFYDNAKNKIQHGLLESFVVQDDDQSNDEEIHETIAAVFRRRSIPLENILGVAADRVSIIYRDLERLKKSLFCENDGAVVFSCNHRSITEVCTFAVRQAMPNNLQQIVRYLVPSALALEQSAIMQDQQEGGGGGGGGGNDDHVIPREAINCGWNSIRWLVEPACIRLLLRHMDVLTELLSKEAANKNAIDEALLKEIVDPYTKAHLMFLNYILTPFKAIQELFRSEDMVLHRLQNECRVQFRVICQHFLTPSAYMLSDLATVDPFCETNLLPIKDVFVGFDCQAQLQHLEPATNELFLTQCRKFLQVASSELQSRIPLTGELLDGLAFLDADVALKEEGRALMPSLNIELPTRIAGFDVVQLSEQWQSLLNFFPEDDLRELRKLPIETMWGVIGGVCTSFDGEEKPDFEQLAKLAKMALSLPLTNRDVARLAEMSLEMQLKRCRPHRPRQSKETILRTLDTIIPVARSLRADAADCRTQRLTDKHRKFYRLYVSKKIDFDDDPNLFI